MTHCLSPEDIEKLWSVNIYNTLSDNNMINLYWYHRIQCMPLVSLQRLTERGVLPAAILNTKKIPLCDSCDFASAHRQSWRTRAKYNHSIHHYHCNKPGSGTSCDHIVSHEPGLISQSTGSLTYKRFWGSVLYVDHMSNFMYNHLIAGATRMETLRSNQAYERVEKDNLRFNEKSFSGDLLKGGQTINF